jgi:hypothetical protein
MPNSDLPDVVCFTVNINSSWRFRAWMERIPDSPHFRLVKLMENEKRYGNDVWPIAWREPNSYVRDVIIGQTTEFPDTTSTHGSWEGLISKGLNHFLEQTLQLNT